MEEHESKGVGIVASGVGVTSSRVSASAPPPLPPSSKPSTAPPPEKRRMYSVELKPGETTIVSWKKLLREDRKGYDSNLAEAVDGLKSGPLVPLFEGELQDAQPSNRFNAVVEKIERLYMGKQSSDEEELYDMPDDDQYDTEDSFIDDAELDEYFQDDKSSTKHNGYFINRGKLEQIEASSSPNLTPKKRRKDSTKANTETDRRHDTAAPAPAPAPSPVPASVTTGNVRIKAAARNALLIGKKSATPSRIQTANGNHYKEGKFSKNKLSACAGTHQKRSADIATNLESISSGRISKDIPSLSLESNDLDRHKTGVLPSTDLACKSRPINESVDTMQQASLDRATSSQAESLSRKSLNCEKEAETSTKIRRKERFGTDEFPNMDSTRGAYPTQVEHPSSTRVNDRSALRTKGTSLERALRDLEKIVAFCRPLKFDFQEVDTSSQGVKRRLPQEVKQKLAKVARLSSSQNRISEDLIDRLMGIVGHIVQRRTLKKNMREMIDAGVSTKQEKSVTYQQIKQAVNEMIKTRLSLLKSKVADQHNGSASDFQEVNGNDERREIRKYGMDIALEDKICDLYNLCVEGMDKDKRPQIRLLYEELAELWPNGYMDSNGIKDAISRSKLRKRSRMYRHKVRDVERIKRKQLASHARAEESSQGDQERLAAEEKVTTNQPLASSSESGHNHGSKGRISSGTGMVIENERKTMLACVKKRKRESDSDSFLQPKASLQLPVYPTSSDQQK